MWGGGRRYVRNGPSCRRSLGSGRKREKGERSKEGEGADGESGLLTGTCQVWYVWRSRGRSPLAGPLAL